MLLLHRLLPTVAVLLTAFAAAVPTSGLRSNTAVQGHESSTQEIAKRDEQQAWIMSRGGTVAAVVRFVMPLTYLVEGNQAPLNNDVWVMIQQKLAFQMVMDIAKHIGSPDFAGGHFMSDAARQAWDQVKGQAKFGFGEPKLENNLVTFDTRIWIVDPRNEQVVAWIFRQFFSSLGIYLVERALPRSLADEPTVVRGSPGNLTMDSHPALLPRAEAICPNDTPYNLREFWSYVTSNPADPGDANGQYTCRPPDQPGFTYRPLKCNGVGTKKWMGREALARNIQTFCELAGQQGVHDAYSGSIMRPYNVGGDYVALNIDWEPGLDFKANALDCFQYMREIMDGCDGLDRVNNPMNWKAGGSLEVGPIKYRITPLSDRYQSGTCSVNVVQHAFWKGSDRTNEERHWTFGVKVEVKDAGGSIVGVNNREVVEAGRDGRNPYVAYGFYQPLEITPQAQDGNYVQFHIGEQNWRSSDTNRDVRPYCDTGDWSGSFDVDYGYSKREMTCYFGC